MKGIFIPEITAEMFKNGCLESIETLMAEGEIYDIDYQEPCEDCVSREDALMCLTGEWTELTDEVIHRFIKRIKNLPLMVFPKHIECEDCVSRQAVDKLFSDAYESKSVNLNEDWKKLIWIREHIKELPSVTPAEKVGRLVDTDDGHSVECSKCGKWFFHGYLAKIEIKYCPNCGARMEVKK